MCNKCDGLNDIFVKARRNPHENYIPTLKLIREMVNGGKIELYAGDCPLEETEELLYEEEHYTICHYLSCKNCNQIFFIGVCIRGTPIYKTNDNIRDENINIILWGHYGTFYRKISF